MARGLSPLEFYAKGAVEMAFTNDASLKDLFKTPSGVTFVPSVE